MDVQLQELIDKIKKDGVSAAENTAADIVAAAEKKSAAIIADAQLKADELVKKAKQEAERMERASISAVEQASRNLLLSFKDGVLAQVTALINAETVKAYNADLLKTLIPEAVKSWIAHGESEAVSVLLSEKDEKALVSNFAAALKANIAKGLEVKCDTTLANGFRIGEKDGSAYYDFSAEAVAELFASYVNPKIAQILKDAAGGAA